jgi:hypothetical protein
MIRITVKSTDLTPRTKKGSSVPFAYEQTGYAWLFDRVGKPEEYPQRVALTHWCDKSGSMEGKAYPPGEYTLAPTSYAVGDYGRLTVAPRLVPLAKPGAGS